MAENRLLTVCQSAWEAVGIQNPNKLAEAYQALRENLQYDGYEKEQPYSAGTVTRALREGKIKKIEAFELALFLMMHGEAKAKELMKACHPQATGKLPYLEIAQMISADPGVMKIKQEINAEQTDQVGLFVSHPLAGKTVLYSLLSSRVENEPAENGNKPKCVLGFMRFEESGSFDGEAFIYFGNSLELKSNGDLKSLEPAFVNSRGTILIEYSLEREHLPGGPKDRRGLIKVRLVNNDGSIIESAEAYKGTYKDLDPEGANVPGQTYFEVIEKYSEPLKELLGRYSEDLLQKMD